MNGSADLASEGISVPAHVVPPPSSVSAEAREFLSQRMAQSAVPLPDVGDKAAWKAQVEQSNVWLTQHMEAGARAFDFEIVTHDIEATKVYEIIPTTIRTRDEAAAILYIHGGAFIHGAGIAGAYMGTPLACTAGIRTYCVDYRMPPDHPFPAGLNDAVETYRWLLDRHRPECIGVAGVSAGGGLAGSLVLKVRDLGLPMPGACMLATPEADLTESGDTFETNIYNDVVLSSRLTKSIALYADGHDLRDPHLSPIFGDFSKGYPPTILTSGTRDAFLSNTVLMHRALLKAGVEAELHVWEAMPHGGFFGAPEDREVLAEQAAFLRKKLAGWPLIGEDS